MKVIIRYLFLIFVLTAIMCGASSVYAVSTYFISAPNRVDMVYDSSRDVLYITSGTSVLRYKTATGSFLSPYTFSLGNLSGIDLSPDGNTLAIADRNITGIHLVDLQTDTIKPDITFAPYISGEGGTFTVAFGNDGALLSTSTYNGSGWAPLRRIDPNTGAVTIIKTIVEQDAMLSASADGKCIGFVEGNISSGPLSSYDVATQKVTNTVNTNGFTYEVGTNRDCTQFAVPTYGGTFIYNNSLTKLRTLGVYAGAQPIGVAYHPTKDIVYFAWSGTSEVRAFDSKTFAQISSFDVGYTFQNTGNHAFGQGRLKLSRDGSLLFATVGNGIRYLRTALNPVADNQSLFVNKVVPTAITLTGSSPKQLPLSYSIVTQPSHGTLQGSAPNLTYTPDAVYSGQDSFTFKSSDGTLESAPATVTITIDKELPIISSFIMPGSSTTLNVAISSLVASDNVGITGFCLTEAATSATCTWSSTPPDSYHFGGIGSHTLYAFVRDAAGNISLSVSVTVNIPEIVPRITAFIIPATYSYNNSTIPVTLNASDDLGVTGYCLTEVADPTSCTWSSWSPTSYALTALGPHTIYAFARNGSGKVSAPASATTTNIGQVNFIPAINRLDMVYDTARDVLYITNGTSVLRYKLASNSFLPSYTFGLGNLSGIDISPDGKTLAIADRNITGIHLVDLQSDTIKPDIMFTPGFGEGGSFTVAFGNDGALLVTTQYNGSGWVPLRRVDPQSGIVTIINGSVRQDTMLNSSANGKCIGYVESNASNGPLSIYDVATQKVTKTVSTDWFNYEVGTNRDCTQFAVPTYGGTFIYDNSLTTLGTIGIYAGGQPIGVAYHPAADIVYFAWAGTSEVRAFDTKTFAEITTFDFGYTFQNTGNNAFGQGRLKVSQDGTLLFATIKDGIRYQSLSTNAPIADNQMVDAYSDAPVPISLTGSSPKNALLTYTIVTPPAHGSLQGTAPNLVYTSNAGFTGQDAISFRVNDGALDSNTATMTITVKPDVSNISVLAPAVKNQLTISWTNPNDPNFSHVHIYRSSMQGQRGTLIADNLTGTTYVDTGLNSQTIYYYNLLAVDKTGYESTNTFQASQKTLADTYSLSVKITGSGTINNLNQPPAFSCSSPVCTGVFNTGTLFTLRATPAQLYSFSGWSDGFSSKENYSLTLTADTSITATFTPLPLVLIDGSSTPYLSFAAAMADAAGSVTIKARNLIFSEDVTLNLPFDIVLTGGFKDDFATTDGCTELQGTLTIGLGKLIVEGLVIR